LTQETRVPRRDSEPEHVVQLFDTSSSLDGVVSAFLNQGWMRGEDLVVFAKSAHWTRIAPRLERRGCPVVTASNEGRLTVLDASSALADILRHGQPNPALFDVTVGTLIRTLTAEGRQVRAYSDLVEILAEEGNFEGAARLEELWNDLRQRCAFTLLCGYSAAHFTDARAAAALQSLCAAHTRAQKNSSDVPGSWLLNDQREPLTGDSTAADSRQR